LCLAVEVDGEWHCFDSRPRKDAERDAWLENRGITTLRIPARDVLASPEAAVGRILGRISARPLRPSGPPPPHCGGGS
jgi:very-short-patch-repair endonuclease